MTMRKYLPNQLTVLRLVLAAAFFAVLNLYRYPHGNHNILWLAIGIFVVAAFTDIADGYLARKWHVESTFGRIMDPFVDKVMIIGAFIYLAGPRFVDPNALVNGEDIFGILKGNMVSGIYPWMVVVILARELLVTGIRGEMESRGIEFGAKWSGKFKTLLQSFGIPIIIGVVALGPTAQGHWWLILLRDSLAYAMVIVTVISGLPYIFSAKKALGIQASQAHLKDHTKPSNKKV